MPQITQLQDVLEFTTLAARTIQDISSASKVPFLGGTAILTLSIVEIIKVSRNCDFFSPTCK
jgi:tRNA A37 N6-isopentenylltransferase MiaA